MMIRRVTGAVLCGGSAPVVAVQRVGGRNGRAAIHVPRGLPGDVSRDVRAVDHAVAIAPVIVGGSRSRTRSHSSHSRLERVGRRRRVVDTDHRQSPACTGAWPSSLPAACARAGVCAQREWSVCPDVKTDSSGFR
eukprot:3899005-Rhodomonas_salina.4